MEGCFDGGSLTNLGPEMTLPALSAVERLLHKGATSGFISKMYVQLRDGGLKIGLHKSRERWESHLNTTIGICVKTVCQLLLIPDTGPL